MNDETCLGLISACDGAFAVAHEGVHGLPLADLVLDAIRRAGRLPAQLPEWAAHYGWAECWRWFPTDSYALGVLPPEPMDVPRPIAVFLPTGPEQGIRRDVSGCVDYRTRDDALRALAVACVLWLRENHGTDRAAREDDSLPVADAARIGGGPDALWARPADRSGPVAAIPPHQ